MAARIERPFSRLEVVAVSCAGMIGADDIRALTEKGAESVRVVGCPRADCVYGVGNLSFKRGSMAPAAPDLPRRWRALAGTDWAAPGHVARAVVRPGDATDPDARHLPPGRSGLTKARLVVVASVPVVAVATLAPYRPETVAGGELAVLVEHVPGRSLVGLDQPTGVSGRPATLRVTIDGGAREFGMRPAGADGPETNLARVRPASRRGFPSRRSVPPGRRAGADSCLERPGRSQTWRSEDLGGA
jgi:hypothetical protein